MDEEVWRRPLAASYDREIDSDVADVKNIASGRAAGGKIGAQLPFAGTTKCENEGAF